MSTERNDAWLPVFAAAPAQPAEPAPEGCTPADARVLREANHALAAESHELQEALHDLVQQVRLFAETNGEADFYTGKQTQLLRRFGYPYGEVIAASPAQPTPPAAHTAAARDVLAERQRQVSAKGWTTEHDDEHTESEMALAAACYAMTAGGYAKGQTPPIWPWLLQDWKPAYGRRDLVRSGALILAEIERLDRLSTTPTKGGE